MLGVIHKLRWQDIEDFLPSGPPLYVDKFIKLKDYVVKLTFG